MAFPVADLIPLLPHPAAACHPFPGFALFDPLRYNSGICIIHFIIREVTAMLKSSDLFHIPFYNKSPYTGSRNGMRFYIEKTVEDDTPLFKVWIFPGPFCFEKTLEDQKESVTFPFTEESLPLICNWLNSRYEERASYWNAHKSPVL